MCRREIFFRFTANKSNHGFLRPKKRSRAMTALKVPSVKTISTKSGRDELLPVVFADERQTIVGFDDLAEPAILDFRGGQNFFSIWPRAV